MSPVVDAVMFLKFEDIQTLTPTFPKGKRINVSIKRSGGAGLEGLTYNSK